MAHICLWGNASDLSFSLQGDANTLQEKHHRTNANKNILVVISRDMQLIPSCRTTYLALGMSFLDSKTHGSTLSWTMPGLNYMPT
jgi:hypothetical protein